jgi:hypothetical protein
MKNLTHALLAVILAMVAAGAAAADYAGVVKTSRGSAAVERAGAKIALAPGSRVNQGDRIVTGSDGFLGITMRDDTLLTLGPGSILALDTYGFDPKTHDGNFLATLTRGVLSVVTGLIAKRSPDAFAVKTRISTMGVRGTEFIVEANEI